MSGTNTIKNADIERTFASTAGLLVENGWSVFPQEVSGRAPGKVHGHKIEWASTHNLKDRLPTPEDIKLWSNHCPNLNVACVFGPASGNTFAIDIDVLDKDIARGIADLADDMLGISPFRRIGRAPKIALIYRCEDIQQMPNISRYLEEKDADGKIQPSSNGVEIQGYGKLITFLGTHHKTGQPFRWLRLNPMTASPEEAPLVTANQVAEFIDAVDSKYHFYRNPSHTVDSVAWQWDDEVRKSTSRLLYAGGGEPWTEDSEGYVVNGREAFLTRICFMHVKDWFSKNDKPEMLGYMEELKINLVRAAASEFIDRIRMNGRWTEGYIRIQTTSKIGRLLNQISNGLLTFQKKYVQEETTNLADIIKESGLEDNRGEELSFLKALKHRKTKVRYKIEEGEETEEELALPEDRTEIETRIANGLTEAFTLFFADVYGDRVGINADNIRSRTHILRAPTGAGKTSRCIRTLAQDPRTYQLYPFRDAQGRVEEKTAPIIMLLPTYNNIDELRDRAKVLNLDGSLNDTELRLKAAEMGLIAEDDLQGRLDELRRDALNCDLNTMVYSGKIRAGCKMKEKVMLAMEAGIGTASFCKSSTFIRPENPNEKGYMEEKFCEYYHICPAIEQRKKIAESHVVFLPHSFMALEIPEELHTARAVIADERIHHLFLHTTDMHLSTLFSMRGHIKMKKKETAKLARSKGQSFKGGDDIREEMETFLEKRLEAGNIAATALENKQCPAQVFFEMQEYRLDGTYYDKGGDLVSAALRICNDNMKREAKMTPDMSLEEVEQHCRKPTGRELVEEHRFWTIIQERMQMLTKDKMKMTAIKNTAKELDKVQTEEERFRLEAQIAKLRAIPDEAKGNREYRIQYVIDTELDGKKTPKIRLSWRTNPNWMDKPFLLLDASSAPEVIAKIWNLEMSDVVVHNIVDDIGKSLNVKTVAIVDSTYANSSIIADALASPVERRVCAEKLSRVRHALNTVSTMYGYGRVVAGTSIALREVINADWPCPDNVDWCHFGAMRGLDMFKFHSAAFSVGRMEVPVRNIDGLVASLTYDDDIPEEPLDKTGTGLDRKGDIVRVPMGEQKNRMRNGKILNIPTPQYKGKWARMLQAQYREEELSQFVGRLRPVYRKGRVPVWFALSSVLPDSIIVDDVIHIEDLLHGRYLLWEAVRKNQGVLLPQQIIKNCGSLFKNERDIMKAMASYGLYTTIDDTMEALESDEERLRSTQGFSIYKWSLVNPVYGMKDDEIEGIIHVAGHIQPEIATLRMQEALIEAEICFNEKEVKLELIWDTEKTIARPRQDDTVDEKMGDRQIRRQREEREIMKLGNMLLDSDVLLDKPHSVTKIDLGKGAGPQDMPELFACESIDGYWHRKENGYDNSLMPLIREEDDLFDEGFCFEDFGNFEALGETVHD